LFSAADCPGQRIASYGRDAAPLWQLFAAAADTH
jgi:hypothetical protein